ncbi:MAG: beta-class carbonic anhydrase [Acidimicrobiales bacterium]
MSHTDELLTRADQYAASFGFGDLPMRPRRPVVVLTCMDARINLYALLGLREGDLNILRNAGGAVTDDVIRSLVVSQRRLGTREIMVIHHRDCGLRAMDESAFVAELAREAHRQPPWPLESFGDPVSDVRRSMARLVASPFLAHRDAIRGFLYDESSGRLEEVEPDPDASDPSA